MAIQMSENFKLLSKEALDGRISYKSLSEMVSMQDSYLYDGCLATIEGDATKKYISGGLQMQQILLLVNGEN